MFSFEDKEKSLVKLWNWSLFVEWFVFVFEWRRNLFVKL